MKKINYIVILGLIFPVILYSCLKVEDVPDPTVNAVRIYAADINGNDSLITQPTHGEKIKFVVVTDADLCSVWPGGIRTVTQTISATDSIDMFGHPVLTASDWYGDYGLIHAKGLKTTLSEEGWYASYVYPNAGTFEVTVVVTKHGYDGPDYKQVVYNAGEVTVK